MSNNARTASGGYTVIKRLFDISFAIVMLVLIAPVLLVVSLAIKLDSPGPILFRQVRLGQRGKPFGLLKFRTMVIEAPETPTGPVFVLRADPRISRVGRFLRMTALDELPTLLNVLRGDMSIVGPRAALPLEADRYSEIQRRRLELKPGITGYWQVFGREAGISDFQKMVEMDLEYADKQSLMLDLKILLCTIAVVLKSNAAY